MVLNEELQEAQREIVEMERELDDLHDEHNQLKRQLLLNPHGTAASDDPDDPSS